MNEGLEYIGKYRRIIEKKEKAGKLCNILHIVKLDDDCGEWVLDTGHVSDYRRIYRTRIYNHRKSSDVDEWAYRQRGDYEEKSVNKIFYDKNGR